MSVITRHSYTATETGPEGTLTLTLDADRPGNVDSDTGRIPYFEGTLTATISDPARLEQLDPRDGRRVTLTATGSKTRTFDLALRDAKPNRAEGTVTLSLASDEAILDDFAQLDDDSTPRIHEASLRAVCDYVLDKIGAHLETGGPDADSTAYWEATNVLLDPACATAASFTGGGNAHTIVRGQDGTEPIPGSGFIQFTSGAAGQAFIQFSGGDPTTRVGETWTLQTDMRRTAAAAPNGVLRVYELAADGATLRQIESPPTAVSTSAWTPLALTFTIQDPRTTKIMVYVSALATAGGQTWALTAPMLHKAGERIPPFSGSAGGPGYTYAWAGAANGSASTRTPIIERVPESLTWRAGISGMEFLRAHLLAAGLRLVCDEQRRWTLRDADYRASGLLTYRDGINIREADEELSLDDWIDAAVYEYTWTDAAGIAQRRLDAYALTTPPRKVLRVELRDTPYPGPGRARNVVERAQGRGRTVTITATPTWAEQTDQALAVTLAGTPIQTGIVGTVTYTLDDDSVTITSRTTDTPALAWDLIPAGDAWTDSPTGESWIEETP